MQLGDGVEVRIRGRIDYYPPQGRLQLVMNGDRPRVHRRAHGRRPGPAAAHARRARALLRANAAHAPMPTVPLRIGLGHVGRERGVPRLRARARGRAGTRSASRTAHARVQGAAADRRIAYALRRLSGIDLDVVVVVRGGGSRSRPLAVRHRGRGSGHRGDAVPGAHRDRPRSRPHRRRRSRAHLRQDAHRGGGDARRSGRRVRRQLAPSRSESRRARDPCVGWRSTRSVRPPVVSSGTARRSGARAPAAYEPAPASRGAGAGGNREAARTLAAHERGVVTAGRRAAELARNGSRRGQYASRQPPGAARAIECARRIRWKPGCARSIRDGCSERGYSITRDDDGRVVRSVADVALGGMLVTEVADGSDHESRRDVECGRSGRRRNRPEGVR